MAEPSLDVNSSLAVAVVMMTVMVVRASACWNNRTGKNDERNGSKEQGTQLHGETPSYQPLFRVVWRYKQPIGSSSVVITYFVQILDRFRR
jgi:hypothetical protein